MGHQKLHIVGASHSLQCGSAPHKQYVEAFQSYVLDICKMHGIRLIAEEMSDDGLRRHGVDQTVIQRVAPNDVEVLLVDIPFSIRSTLGIDDRLRAVAAQSDAHPDARILYESKLIETIRECSWLATIIRRDSWPALLICGADHVPSLVDRVKELNIPYVIEDPDYPDSGSSEGDDA